MSNRTVSKVVIAPPGPLGIKVKPVVDGRGLAVLTVDFQSPLLGQLDPGDWIVSMDGLGVTAVSDLASKKDEGRLLGVLTSYDQQRLVTEKVKSAIGPPIHLLEYAVEPRGAPLGLMLSDKHVVVQVCEGSPMEGKIWKKDRIYAVNAVGVSSLTMTQLATYLARLQENFEFVTLQVERDPKRKKNPQKPFHCLKQTATPPPAPTSPMTGDSGSASGGVATSTSSMSTTDKPNSPPAATSPEIQSPNQQQQEQHEVKPPTKSIGEWTHEFMSPEGGFAKNAKIRVAQRKNYPALAGYGISLATDEESAKLRERILSELIMWNEKHKCCQEFDYQDRRHRLFWVPCGHGPTLFDDTPTKQVLQACRQSLLFDQNVNAISKYFGLFSYEKGLDLLLTYFAQTQAKAYDKFSKVAQQVMWEQETQRKRHVAAKERRKKKQKTDQDDDEQDEETEGKEHDSESEPIVLPEDYQDYDGTGDARWNIRYMALIRFYQENGHCMVTTREVPLGKWVAWQRESYRKNYAALTDRRKELLDNLGFVWEAKHVNRKPHVDTGDPRLNKALATRVVFGQQFSDRQVFLLSGFTREEMEEVRNPAHQWRNGLVVLKKRLDARLKAFLARVKKEDEGSNNLPRRKTYSAVQELISTLQDADKPDRFAQVYGEANATLLDGFLSGAVTDEQVFNAGKNYVVGDNNLVNMSVDDETGFKDGHLEDVMGNQAEEIEETNEKKENPCPIDATVHMDANVAMDASRMFDAATGIRPAAAAAWGSAAIPDLGVDETAEDQDPKHQSQQMEEKGPGSPWRRDYVLPTTSFGEGGVEPDII
ncbi:hypothetical protein ACA910_010581 [Epithemia clementina (nom. ined.)]